jgi:three-Cys-motif partner protein
MALDDPVLVEDDGLRLSKAGPWAANKHEKIGYYCSLFATSMKKHWHCRVYIDLFAGAGKCRVKDSKRIVAGSPLLSLAVDDQFDEYIFCESDLQNIDSLEKRVQKYFPSCRCTFFPGDSNANIQKVIDAVPVFTENYKGLTFCLVDPYNSSDLHFSTINSIADALLVDFLILIPSFMDINRNAQAYLNPANTTLDRMLGNNAWRGSWHSEKENGLPFGSFITDQFCQQMKAKGFLYEGLQDVELVRFVEY